MISHLILFRDKKLLPPNWFCETNEQDHSCLPCIVLFANSESCHLPSYPFFKVINIQTLKRKYILINRTLQSSHNSILYQYSYQRVLTASNENWSFAFEHLCMWCKPYCQKVFSPSWRETFQNSGGCSTGRALQQKLKFVGVCMFPVASQNDVSLLPFPIIW